MAWSSETLSTPIPISEATDHALSKEPATVRLLLLSRDIRTIETISFLTQQLAMHLDVCCSTEAALRKLCRSKFEGVIIDLDEQPGAIELLRKVRSLTSHRDSVSYAVVSQEQDIRPSLQAGANFVWDKSSGMESIQRILRASYPLLVREKRRYFRHPVQVPVTLLTDNGPILTVSSVNISEGGIAISASTLPPTGSSVLLRFHLPEVEQLLTMAAEVCWNRAGVAGLEFREMTDSVREVLYQWLSAHLQKLIPQGRSTGSEQSQKLRARG